MRSFRIPLLASLLLAPALPATADGPPALEQLPGAAQLFLPTGGGQEHFLELPATLMSGLAGDWVPLNAVIGSQWPSAAFTEGNPADTEKLAAACEKSAMRLEQPSAYGFTLTHERAGLTHTYTALSGSRFLLSVDPDALFGWLFPSGTPEPPSLRDNVLRSSLGPVDLYRPSPDILVVAKDGLATLYLRCAAAG